MTRSPAVITIFARLALGFSFLSAVADRFGLWGAYGAPHVAWGDFARFTSYTARLNWYLPPAFVPALAWLATAFEVAIGVALIVGMATRIAAFAGGLLLSLFALSMCIALGPKTALDASVFSAAAASFFLATAEADPLSVDSISRRRPKRPNLRRQP